MQEQQANRRKAITIAVVLHVTLAAVLVLGIEFSDYRPLSGPKVEIIEAELVATPAKPRVDPEIERRKQELANKQRQAAEEAKRRQELEAQESQLKAEEQRKQAENLKQQKLEQQKQAETLARQQQEAEQKRKAEQAAKLKAEAEARKKAEDAARQKKAQEEAERKALAEQQAREKLLQEALAQEQRERELNPLEDAYSSAISQQIARNWLKPPGISDNLKCEALVIQIPDGTVTSVNITTSSGNAVFDDSVIKAIYKASPLPQPPSPEVFDRELRIGFCSTGNVCE